MLVEYGIADHAPMPNEPFDDWRMAQADLPAYFAWIERARIAAKKFDLPIRCGLECDWLPGCAAWINHLRSLHDWDYLIGSVHYLGDSWDFDNPKWLGKWAQLDLTETWQSYFNAYAKMAESQLFEILGHPDLIKKFGYIPDTELVQFYDPAIEAIAKSGACIELNTAGWHKPCKEAYPSEQFLQKARAADIPLVVSSDAHAPSHVGRDFKRALSLLKSVGYTETQTFQRGERRAIKLPTSIG